MQDRKKKEQGFTLIELLVAIVVVGILTAVAIVGIAGLTDKGSSSACTATADAAQAASAVFYANSPTSQYPTQITELTTAPSGGNAALVPQSGVTTTAATMKGKGWTMTIGGGGNNPATFTCTTP